MGTQWLVVGDKWLVMIVIGCVSKKQILRCAQDDKFKGERQVQK
jgi:hypothetical protein